MTLLGEGEEKLERCPSWEEGKGFIFSLLGTTFAKFSFPGTKLGYWGVQSSFSSRAESECDGDDGGVDAEPVGMRSARERGGYDVQLRDRLRGREDRRHDTLFV